MSSRIIMLCVVVGLLGISPDAPGAAAAAPVRILFGSRIGAIDFSGAVHVHKRAHGTYVILVEDDEFAKIIYYLWKPNR